MKEFINFCRGRQVYDQRTYGWLAWHSGVLSQTPKPPSLDSLMGLKTKSQDLSDRILGQMKVYEQKRKAVLERPAPVARPDVSDNGKRTQHVSGRR